MTLADILTTAQTGDVLLVHGNDTVQRLIEFDTVSPFCHVALLVIPFPGSLLVCEMVEGQGFQSMTVEDWFAGRPGQNVFFGQAPDKVRAGGQLILDSLREYEDKDRQQYGYGELLTVFISQITGKDYETRHEVCSLFVQHRWAVAGYATAGCAAPGSFLFLCESVSLIK